MKRRCTALGFFWMICGLSLIFSAPVHSEPYNLTLAKKELTTYHDSGLYQKELSQKIQEAQRYIIQQALVYQQMAPDQKLALVLDIDETSLSNYNKLVQYDFSLTSTAFRKEILAANAPAIQPMLTLYREAIKHKIRVFFVTGRRQSEGAATIKNLLNAGYKHWTALYLRPDQYALPSITPFKSSARAKISKQGYIILASIGDQYSDIRGGYAQKGFKLPNPYYYLP